MSTPPPPDVREEITPFLAPHLPDTEEIQDSVTAAAVDAAAAGEIIEGLSPAEALKKIHEQQLEQSLLIVDMQSTITDLSTKQHELEDEIKGLKDGRWVVRAEPKRHKHDDNKDGAMSRAHAAMLSVGSSGRHGVSGVDGTTEDDEIDAIVECRRVKKTWPLKRKYCTGFTNEVELLKIRFHRSEKHPHRSVRIPKVDRSEGYGLGNREGRLICRLCSGKTINRNTSWMCATCCVPLCVDTTNGDMGSSCHARWHSCQDLVAVNATLNAALRERRESKKRCRDEVVDTVGDTRLVELAAVQMQLPEMKVEVVPPLLPDVKVEEDEMVQEHQLVDPNDVTASEEVAQQEVDSDNGIASENV